MQYSTDQKALIALAEAEVPARRGYDIWEFFESGDDFLPKRRQVTLYAKNWEHCTIRR